jgi:hypothetical protein
MLRTAEEILASKFPNAYHLDWFKPIVNCINEARIETIRECAEVAETSVEHDYHGDGEGYEYNIVNKQSILNLIEQVK